jgi:hypothetical protein
LDVLVATVAERPDLVERLDDFPGAWPEFLHHHRLSALFYDSVPTSHADFCLVAVDPDAPGMPIAKAYSMAVSWAGVDALPPDGHDGAILQATADRLDGRAARLVVAVEVTVQVGWQGRGVSRIMLEALRANAARHGFTDLVVPVRPTGKHGSPELSLAQYAAVTRADGLPADPWLRVHVRAGGRIAGIAPTSMTLAAPLAAWRSWTGLPFDVSGPVVVPEALVPVHCDVANDVAVYVEPNVWVHHPLTA